MIFWGILQGAIGFCAYMGLILVLLRVARGVDATFTVLLSALFIYILTFVLILVVGYQMNFWVFSTSYWFLVLSFLMVFGAIYKSLSLRMLQTLLEEHNHRYSVEGLRDEYIFGESFSNRLQLIVKQDLAERVDGKLALTKRGAKWANFAVKLQRSFGIMRSG
jgi:small-conductance mechanosensitive channel